MDTAESDIRPQPDPAIKIGYVEVGWPAGMAGRASGNMEGIALY